MKFCIIVPGIDVDYYKAWSDSRCSRKLTMRLTKNGGVFKSVKFRGIYRGGSIVDYLVNTWKFELNL